MAILNYTTGISVDKTAAEIQKKLVLAGAAAVMCEYDQAGILSFISFRMIGAHGELTFRLPANVDKVHRALMNDKKVEKRLKTKEQAARVAWRIIKDWIEAQLAIIQADMVTLAEVFLPYAQTRTGETVYECFEKQGLPQLTYSPPTANP